MNIISMMEKGYELEYIGSLAGVPFFIDATDCPFTADIVFKYNPARKYLKDPCWLSSLPEELQSAAIAAMKRRDEGYKKSRPAEPDGMKK